jgi:hypothetical protein
MKNPAIAPNSPERLDDCGHDGRGFLIRRENGLPGRSRKVQRRHFQWRFNSFVHHRHIPGEFVFDDGCRLPGVSAFNYHQATVRHDYVSCVHKFKYGFRARYF